jgi:hypothetical protein
MTRTASIFLLASFPPPDLLRPRLYPHLRRMTIRNLVLPTHQAVPTFSFLAKLAPTTPSYLRPVVASLQYRRRDHRRIGLHRAVRARQNPRRDTQVLAVPNPLQLVSASVSGFEQDRDRGVLSIRAPRRVPPQFESAFSGRLVL